MVINKILIVGLGSIGKRHLRIARNSFPDATIKVLRHQKTTESPQYSNGCFSSIKEAIAFAPQIGVVANPAPFHIATAQALADIGVHLLIEKPLSTSLDGILELLETSKKKDTVLLTGYNLRFLPSLQYFRELILKGTIGKILSVRSEVGQYLPSWRPNSDYSQGVSAKRALGGGALCELSHELDYIPWIFGEVNWVKATLSKQSSLDIDVEDTAHLILGFTPSANESQLIATVNLDFIRHDTTQICTAIGEKGSLRWNGITGRVTLLKATENEWHELVHNKNERDQSYLDEWHNFISCIKDNKKPLVTGEDGLKALHIILAAQQSATSERKTTL